MAYKEDVDFKNICLYETDKLINQASHQQGFKSYLSIVFHVSILRPVITEPQRYFSA